MFWYVLKACWTLLNHVEPHPCVSFHPDLPGFRPHALRGNRKTWCHGIAVPASISHRGLVGSNLVSTPRKPWVGSDYHWQSQTRLFFSIRWSPVVCNYFGGYSGGKNPWPSLAGPKNWPPTPNQVSSWIMILVQLIQKSEVICDDSRNWEKPINSNLTKQQ